MLIPCVSVSAVMLLVCVCALLQVPLAHSLTRSLSLPHEEVSALHDLFDSTGGPSGGWAWKNESEFGVAWNFSQANDGSYLHDPCVDWQGVQCISVSGSGSAGEEGGACNTTRALDQDQGEEEVHCRIVMLNLFEYNLTGSVPSSLGVALSRLQELTLWRNVLSSSIPSSLGLLTDLVLLDFDETGIEGKIPAELSKLNRLKNFYAAANRLTGTLPPELGTLSSLRVLFLYENQISGPLPNEFGQLTNLEDLIIHTNRLVGTIPYSIGANLNKMRAIFLQGNAFTGSLDPDFFKYSDVETLDITNNQLTGQLPPGLFEARNLQTLALSINCFSGTLPSSVCSMTKALVISLDGLGASTSCSGIVEFPITKIKLFNTLEGTIPPCIWNLPNLTLFHVAGNGLTGSLPQVPATTNIRNLSLAHNKLSGTIPYSLQAADFVELDLSYNKLTGEYSHGDHGHSDEHDGEDVEDVTTMILQVNRLSGPLHETAYSVLRILDGNLFGCDYIPGEDEHSDTHACGSILLDEAMSSVMIIGFFTSVILCFIIFITNSEVFDLPSLKQLKFFIKNQAVYFKFLIDVNGSESDGSIANIRKFGVDMIHIAKFSVVFLVSILFFTAPIYFLKYFGIGESHTYQYRWLFNLVYMKGELIAVLMLIAWIGVIGTVFFLYYKCVINRAKDRQSDKSAVSAQNANIDRSDNAPYNFKMILQYFVLGSLNLFIVVMVNGAYVYSSYQNLAPTTTLGIQLGLAIFKMMYNLMFVPILTLKISDVTTNIAVRSRLNIFNNLLIPCVATAFTSPTCYQGLIQEPHEVLSSYTFSYCYVPIVINDTSACLQSIIKENDIAALIPPFNYNYQCGSVILTSYIPVFIYGYALQLVMPFMFVALAILKFDHLPRFVKPNVHGVLWPNFWLYNSNDSLIVTATGKRADNVALPERILKVKFLMSQDILYHIANLLTFGVCSPFLATIITICLIMKLLTWVMVLGRFLYVRSKVQTINDSNSDNQMKGVEMRSFSVCEEATPVKVNLDDAVTALSEACIGLLDVFDVTLWPIIWSSCLFFALLTFDIAADEVGAVRAIWIPLVCLCVPPTLKYFLNRGRASAQECEELSPQHHQTVQDPVTNPLAMTDCTESLSDKE